MSDLQDGWFSLFWPKSLKFHYRTRTLFVHHFCAKCELSTMLRWVLCPVAWFCWHSFCFVLFSFVFQLKQCNKWKNVMKIFTSRIGGDVIGGKSHWVWWGSQWDAPNIIETKRPKLNHRLSWPAVEGKNRVLEIFHGVLACLETGALSSVALYSRIDSLAS